MFKHYPLVNVAVRNGLIAGVLGMVLFLGLYFMGRHPFLIPLVMDFRILLFAVLIFFTQKEFRDYFQQGILYFWQGMMMSFLFTLVFSAIGSVAVWAFCLWKPEFVTTYISLKLEQARELPPETITRIGKEHFDQIVAALPATRGVDLAFVYFWQSFVISLFISIIISVILRRQPKP